MIALYVSQALRKNLLEQISEAYPTETEAYRALRTASALVSVLEFDVCGQQNELACVIGAIETHR